MTRIHLTVREQPWLRYAACAGMDPEIFFLSVGASSAEAKRVCAGCPARVGCLQWALETACDHGVFGGLSPRERRGMRRNQIERVARCGTDAGYYRHLRSTLTDPCGACRHAHTEASRERATRRRTA